MQLALGLDAGMEGNPGRRLVASAWPWRAVPMVLMTIDRAPSQSARGDAPTRPGHAQQQASLGLGRAWGLEADLL